MANKPDTKPTPHASGNAQAPDAASNAQAQQKPLPPKPQKPKTILIYESESFKSKGKRE